MIRLRCERCGHEWSPIDGRVLPVTVLCSACHTVYTDSQIPVKCWEKHHPGKKAIVFKDDLMCRCDRCGFEREWRGMNKHNLWRCGHCHMTTTFRKAHTDWCLTHGEPVPDYMPSPPPRPRKKPMFTPTKAPPERKFHTLTVDHKRDIAKRWISWDGSIVDFLREEGLDYRLLNHALKSVRSEFSDTDLYGQESQKVVVTHGT